ncbi:MAG: TonB-dependent receptor [Chitinophagales bacterium]|nr:TonB-dependent receptor [Chitinophagales bacterium]
MSKQFLIILSVLISVAGTAFSQSGKITGRVFNAINNEPIEFATVGIDGTSLGTSTDSAGNFVISGLQPGLYNLKVSSVGFKSKTIFEIQVSNSAPAQVDVPLESMATELTEVTVKSDAFDKSDESPVSLRTIGVNEIQRNPGGNRDISRVVQSFPGVSYTVSFRSDLIIRGGAPNENRFFLDDVEVPTINHFATQGSSGGPVGMINVDFIKEVEFYSGAFPADKGSGLSSLFEFKQKDGRNDRIGFTATVGSSDLGLTLEGPIGSKSNFIFSVRRSYLQFLFKALELPFLPTYNDYQLKYKVRFDRKNELSVISLGALDHNELNLSANKTAEQQYLLGVLPWQDQWNYTFGVVYKHFGKNNFITAVASRNMLNNESNKYENNDESSEANLLLNYQSQEIENKLRLENNWYRNNLKIYYGVAYEYVKYNNATYQKRSDPSGNVFLVDFSSQLDFSKFAGFGQISYPFFDRRLVTSFGLRTDFTNYDESMSNPLDQLSPRLSLTYNISDQFNLNFNAGIYHQLPPYTVMGYRSNDGELVNKTNNVSYITNKQLVFGGEYYSSIGGRISLEGFYKGYTNYPFLLKDSISLANLGADFGVIGNEPAVSTSEGRSYGVELLLQQKIYKGFYGLAAFTFFRSEFKDKRGNYVPSSWDNRFVTALTAGKKFPRNWEVGAKWRFSAGSPYTPYDTVTSALIPVWNVNNQGIPDYNRLNSLRIASYNQIDVRVDKKWFLSKFSIDLYLDIQNLLNAKVKLPPYLDVVRDENGVPVEDPNNPGSYQIYYLDNTSGTVLPSIGLVFEY